MRTISFEPSFKTKHTALEEKDNTPSVTDELYKKFDLTEKDEVTIFPLLKYFPWFSIQCGTTQHTDYMQCCHAGLELGYNPYDLLHAPQEVQCEAIEKLWRRKNFSTKLLPSIAERYQMRLQS